MLSRTQEIIREVEVCTEKPVLISDDASLQTMATIRIAGSSDSAHVLRYNPKYRAWYDYLVAFQCGFVLRHHEAPLESQYMLISVESAREALTDVLVDHLAAGGTKLPEETVTKVRDQFYDGVLQQLRSIPISLRVDEWLIEEHVEAREQQGQAALAQIQEGHQVLRPDIKKVAPEVVYDASVIMNAAFAVYWNRVLDDVSLITPYRLSGHLAQAERLIHFFDQLDPDPSNDKQLIAGWGEVLGISNWFELVAADSSQ